MVHLILTENFFDAHLCTKGFRATLFQKSPSLHHASGAVYPFVRLVQAVQYNCNQKNSCGAFYTQITRILFAFYGRSCCA